MQGIIRCHTQHRKGDKKLTLFLVCWSGNVWKLGKLWTSNNSKGANLKILNTILVRFWIRNQVYEIKRITVGPLKTPQKED